MSRRQASERPLGWRLLWFVALWCGGVLTVAALAYLIRLAMPI